MPLLDVGADFNKGEFQNDCQLAIHVRSEQGREVCEPSLPTCFQTVFYAWQPQNTLTLFRRGIVGKRIERRVE